MKINSIRIVDFRGIEDKTFNFDHSFNVLIGENGTGKTSILEALSASINSYVAISQGRNIRPIRKEDVRVETFGHSIEKKTKTSLIINGEIDGQKIEWEIKKTHFDFGYRQGDENQIRKIAKDHVGKVSENGGSNLILPVFDYLGCGRLFSEPSKSLKTLPKGSRFEGYYDCLDSRSSIKRFASWFKTMELSLLQGNETAKWRAQVIKRAVRNCLEGWETIFFGIEEDQLMAVKSSDKKEILPFTYLSDGQRGIVGIVADIAFRCVLLNPYLELDAAKESTGIVLIDELDLHLHPNWQRTIVKKLKETFPKIQFITTTHSPFITQSLSSEGIINLDELTDIDPSKIRVDEVATTVMGVDSAYSQGNEDIYEKAKVVLTKIKSNATPQEIEEEINKVHDPAVRAFLELNKMANGK